MLVTVRPVPGLLVRDGVFFRIGLPRVLGLVRWRGRRRARWWNMVELSGECEH